MKADPQLISRARGALLGLVAGNQLGVPTERLGTADAIRRSFPNGCSATSTSTGFIAEWRADAADSE